MQPAWLNLGEGVNSKDLYPQLFFNFSAKTLSDTTMMQTRGNFMHHRHGNQVLAPWQAKRAAFVVCFREPSAETAEVASCRLVA
eukprot:5616096-Amphidinium_carterae.1